MDRILTINFIFNRRIGMKHTQSMNEFLKFDDTVFFLIKDIKYLWNQMRWLNVQIFTDNEEQPPASQTTSHIHCSLANYMTWGKQAPMKYILLLTRK